MARSETLRGKTSALRRRHILEAAIRVFAERGFHRATIRDVADEAGVADGTIYNAFENKHALLVAILDARPGVPDPDAAPPASADPDPRSSVRRLIERQWAAFTPETLTMLRVVLSEVLVDAELRRLYLERVIAPALALPEPSFEAFVAAGTLVSDDLPMTLRLMTATFFGLVMLRLLGDERLERDQAAVPGALAGLVLEGLLPRAGAARP